MRWAWGGCGNGKNKKASFVGRFFFSYFSYKIYYMIRVNPWRSDLLVAIIQSQWDYVIGLIDVV